MTTRMSLGDSVEGETLIYGRWSHPPRTHHIGKRLKGKIRRNGWIEVDEPLAENEGDPEGTDPGDRILCHTAALECERIVDRGQANRPRHRGFSGLLKGSAWAKITRELAQK